VISQVTPPIRLGTLGAIELRAEGRGELRAVLRQPKRLALLTYLAVASPRGFHRRDTLVALFWPDLDDEHARGALRQAVRFLRRHLGENALMGRGEEELALGDGVWCDAVAFERAAIEARAEEALELYRGDFLAGFYVSDAAPELDQWVEAQRARLSAGAAQAAWQLAAKEELEGSASGATHWARRAMALAPQDESALRQLVSLLDRLGDRAGAIRVYDDFAQDLVKEYEAEPSAETQALVAAVRARVNAPKGSAARKGPGVPKAETPPDAVDAAPARVEPASRRGGRRALLGVIGAVAAAGVLVMLRPGREPPAPAQPTSERTAIAVLPFQNLSAEGPHTYFAGGLHDELLTQLSKVAALKVISRTSVMGYEGTRTPLRQIASELGVGSVVEGSVQVVAGRLRVSVQLIDAATDAHVWTERYDRPLDDAFAIQSDVAQQIVAAVGAALSGAERQGLAEAPTANAEAYRLYLRGREYAGRPGFLQQNYEIAQQLFEQALALDPDFALAHAALSEVHGRMYYWRWDPSPARATRQRDEAEAALRLAPDLPQAHVAMSGAHYFGRRDYRRALKEARVALKGLPNDAWLWSWSGTVHRRLGNWNEAAAAFEKAVQFNPRDPNLFFIGADTYRTLRRYAQAVDADNRALTLAPDLHAAAIRKGHDYLLWQGQLDTLRAVLSRMPAEAPVGWLGTRAAQHVQLLLWERNADSLLQVATSARVPVFEAQFFFLPRALYAAWAHQMRGDEPAARAAFHSAHLLLDSVLKKKPHDWRVHAARGLALAGLRRRAEALGEARWLQQSAVYREDAFEGPVLAEDRGRILAQAGEADAALDEIQRLLGRPSWLSVHTLRLDPRWDPIRDHPRFQALVTKHTAGSTP
jgi:serine/threonine-protein kinase